MEIVDFYQSIPENFVTIGCNSLQSTRKTDHIWDLKSPRFDLYDAEDDYELNLIIRNNLLETIQLVNTGIEVPVYGVDTSNIELGETKEGFLTAIRGTIVWRENKAYQYIRHGPFIFHITEVNKRVLFNTIQKTCFQDERGNIPTLDKISESIRNMLERWLQRQLCVTCKESLLLWDGSLTTRRINTPPSVLSTLLQKARNAKNVILALSKKTTISALGRRVGDLIDDRIVPCLLDVDDIVRSQYGKYLNFLGKIYLMKLKPSNLSFRLDVDRRISKDNGIQAVENLLCSDLTVDGYPETLRLAHVLSRFSAGEVLAMQRYVAEKYGLRVLRRPDIRKILFGPYGGIRY